MDLPDVHERLEVADIHCEDEIAIHENLISLSLWKKQRRGAELEQVVISALFHAFSEGRALIQ